MTFVVISVQLSKGRIFPESISRAFFNQTGSLIRLNLHISDCLVATDLTRRILDTLLVQFQPIKFWITQRPDTKSVSVNTYAIRGVKKLPCLEFSDVVTEFILEDHVLSKNQ